MNRRNIPTASESEASLLGAILLRPAILRDVIRMIDPADFYSPMYQTLYTTIIDMYQTGRAVDTVTVATECPDIDSHEVASLIANTPSVSAWGTYAEQVIEASRRRVAIAHFADLIDNCYNHSTSLDTVLGNADISNNRLLARRDSEVSGLYDIASFVQSAQQSDVEREWLLPGLLKALWRVIIVAPEGIGKAVLMRFLAVHAAAGRDPWAPHEFITPRRVLYIDVENPTGAILHQLRLANRMPGVDILEESKDHLHIWHREGGMNLRDRKSQSELEAVLTKVQPEMVFAGPLYKLYRRHGKEDMEQAALEFTEVLDDFRVRFGFSIMLEHHAPKGSGVSSHRELNPFGSSLFMRWPEFGITMEPMGGASMTEDKYELELGRFRRDREIADWPDRIGRGSSVHTPWRPYWGAGRGTKIKSNSF